MSETVFFLLKCLIQLRHGNTIFRAPWQWIWQNIQNSPQQDETGQHEQWNHIGLFIVRISLKRTQVKAFMKTQNSSIKTQNAEILSNSEFTSPLEALNYKSCSLSISSQLPSPSSHWCSRVIFASQFKQFKLMVSGGTGVKTSGAGKEMSFFEIFKNHCIRNNSSDAYNLMKV